MPDPIPKQERDEMRKRCEAATPPPWSPGRTDMRSWLADGTPVHYLYRGDAEDVDTRVRFVPLPTQMRGESRHTEDAVFCAHARADLPRLLDAYEAAIVENEALRFKITEQLGASLP